MFAKLIENSIVAIVMALASFSASFSVVKAKQKEVEEHQKTTDERVKELETELQKAKEIISARNVEIATIYRRLDKLDELKIGENFAEIKATLNQILSKLSKL